MMAAVKSAATSSAPPSPCSIGFHLPWSSAAKAIDATRADGLRLGAAYGGKPAECMQASYKNVRCSAVPLPRCRYCFFACAMHLEMASSLPAAEDCDVQVAAESAATRTIKSILPIFMFSLLCSAARRGSPRCSGRPPRAASSPLRSPHDRWSNRLEIVARNVAAHREGKSFLKGDWE